MCGLENKMDSISISENQEKTENKNGCNVNKKLLPIKCHYFLESAASSCIEPFATIYAKQLGLSATSVGFIQSMTPFLSIISKPLLGGVVDCFQILKVSLLLFVFLRAISYATIPFIPGKPSDTLKIAASLICSNSWTVVLPENISYLWHCLASEPFSCMIDCYNCSSNYLLPSISEIMSTSAVQDEYSICQSKQLNLTLGNANLPNLEFAVLSENTDCFKNFTATCTLTCPCVRECCSSATEVISLQFWIFLIMRIIFTVFGEMTTTLTDAACYEQLDGNIAYFGRQRLFGSVGWGIFSLITGVLMDAFPKEEKSDFLIGVYIMVCLVAIDFIPLSKLSIRLPIPSQNIFKDVGGFFTSFEAVVFMAACAICGGLESLHSNYLFWYLEDMGATKTLVALSLTVNTLFSEAPIFVYTGVIIEKLGNFLCVVVVLLVFSIRHFCYSFIYNPWLALPISLFHGITFSILYASMTSYAKMFAKSGTEATMQGLFGGLYVGVGQAIGSLAAGYSFDKYGGRMTFRISGTTAAVSGIVMLIIYQQLRIRNQRNAVKIELEMSNLK